MVYEFTTTFNIINGNSHNRGLSFVLDQQTSYGSLTDHLLYLVIQDKYQKLFICIRTQILVQICYKKIFYYVYSVPYPLIFYSFFLFFFVNDRIILSSNILIAQFCTVSDVKSQHLESFQWNYNRHFVSSLSVTLVTICVIRFYYYDVVCSVDMNTLDEL